MSAIRAERARACSARSLLVSRVMYLAVAAALTLSELAQTSLCDAPACPTIRLGVRTGGALNQVMIGAHARLFRAQPEVLFGFRPADHATLLFGGGAGPAYFVGPSRAAMDLTLSGALGVRVAWSGAELSAIVRAEAALRGAAAITLDVRVTFGRAR